MPKTAPSSPLTPVSDHIILRAKRETTTASGIVIPDTAKDTKSDRGEVIAVGPGRLQDDGTRAPMEVKPGDQILFSKYAADEIEVNGEDLLVISMSDVKAIIQ